jgi:hypothetical protein
VFARGPDDVKESVFGEAAFVRGSRLTRITDSEIT